MHLYSRWQLNSKKKMSYYHLIITSKNKKSLNTFIIFFNYITKKFNLTKKCIQSKNKKKILTILKSPHVNKTSQEQFEVKTFSKQFNIYSPLNSKTLILLKKIKINLFPEIKIKIKFYISKKLYNKTYINIFNPVNFNVNVFAKKISKVLTVKKIEQQKNNELKKINTLLKILDIYGEFLLQ